MAKVANSIGVKTQRENENYLKKLPCESPRHLEKKPVQRGRKIREGRTRVQILATL